MLKSRFRIAGEVLVIATLAGSAAAQSPRAPINTLNDLEAALLDCWVPPPIEQSRPGMQITALMSFKRNGELFGQPRITFQSSDASDAERASYRTAVVETLKRCASLPFTEAFGNGMAGEPFTMRFVDDRARSGARPLAVLEMAPQSVRALLPRRPRQWSIRRRARSANEPSCCSLIRPACKATWSRPGSTSSSSLNKQTWGGIRKIADAPEAVRHLTFKSEEYSRG